MTLITANHISCIATVGRFSPMHVYTPAHIREDERRMERRERTLAYRKCQCRQTELEGMGFKCYILLQVEKEL
ncbi:hypothetical protein JOB18_002081 [Solea senegalensis]|uniref:Uncharacterized protein n=1 Tax=Solea senegalensis TaxID=28829 RepID=A0AAV6QJQ7_SOLSE|nr:hypothetical protein JOB18_002081 [Solea senegalensis]